MKGQAHERPRLEQHRAAALEHEDVPHAQQGAPRQRGGEGADEPGRRDAAQRHRGVAQAGSHAGETLLHQRLQHRLVNLRSADGPRTVGGPSAGAPFRQEGRPQRPAGFGQPGCGFMADLRCDHGLGVVARQDVFHEAAERPEGGLLVLEGKREGKKAIMEGKKGDRRRAAGRRAAGIAPAGSSRRAWPRWPPQRCSEWRFQK